MIRILLQIFSLLFISYSIQAQCTAAFTLANTGNKSIEVTNASTGYDQIIWYFGDGDTSHNENSVFNYTYDWSGIYEVCAILYDTSGNTCDTLCQSVTVTASNYNITISLKLESNVTPSSGNVYIYRYNYSDQVPEQKPSDTLMFSGGEASAILESGDYYILAEADADLYPPAIPTYFGDTAYWDAATKYSVTGSDTVNIVIQEYPELNGTGIIRGTLAEGEGYNKGPGDPLKGINVSVAWNDTDEPMKGSATDSLGIFEFDNIPQWTCYFYVDMPGITTEKFLVDITEPGQVIDNVEGTVDSNKITFRFVTGIKEIESGKNLSVHPNPSSGWINISYTLTGKNEVIIELYDITGRKVAEIYRDYLKEGFYQQAFSLKRYLLKNGIYFLRINSGDTLLTRKLILSDNKN